MKLIVLVGPCGSGKSSYSEQLCKGTKESPFRRVSQDDQGKKGHIDEFNHLLLYNQDIIIDRMNFDKAQRNRYIEPARKAGYTIEIVVFHVPRQVCFDRMMAREGHPTINGNKAFEGMAGQSYGEATKLRMEAERDRLKAEQANSALDTFFTKYERVEDTEADVVTRLGWVDDTHKTKPAIICDLDGTLCNIEHRLKHVKHEVKKNNRWDLFNKEIPNDGINEWCKKIVGYMGVHYPIIFCSGRVDSTRQDTENWLLKHGFEFTFGTDDKERGKHYRHLFMRHRSDFRQDYIIKEIILDFEILPRYNVLFAIDDRDQVCKMWRRRGIVCLQCAPGDF